MDSALTPAFAAWGILICVAFSGIELLCLVGAGRFAESWRELRRLSLVNIVFYAVAASAMGALGGASFPLLIFPLPILPCAYVTVKWRAYRKVRSRRGVQDAGTFFRRTWLLAIGMLIFQCVAGYYALDSFSRINPTQENFEAAIRDGREGWLEAMLWLRWNGAPDTTILVNDAITSGNLDAVRRLVRHGADPRREYWLRQGNRDSQWFLIKWMLDQGLKPEEINTSQSLPFEALAVGGAVEDLQYCIAKGFDPKKYSYVIDAAIDEQPMEDIAAINAHMREKMRILLAHGADIHATNPFMVKPVFSLMLLNLDLSPVLTFLIENGADVNAPSVSPIYQNGRKELPPGITPLMLAVMDGRTAYVDILLKNGADKNARDSSGRAALDYAADDKTGVEIKAKFSAPAGR